jgi:hypothetical protein
MNDDWGFVTGIGQVNIRREVLYIPCKVYDSSPTITGSELTGK